MNGFFSKSGNLMLAVCDAHAHQETVLDRSVLALLKFVIIGIKLVNHLHVFELLSVVVVGLSSDDQNLVVVPRKIYSDNM